MINVFQSLFDLASKIGINLNLVFVLLLLKLPEHLVRKLTLIGESLLDFVLDIPFLMAIDMSTVGELYQS